MPYGTLSRETLKQMSQLENLEEKKMCPPLFQFGFSLWIDAMTMAMLINENI